MALTMLLGVLYPILLDMFRVCGILVLVIKDGDHDHGRFTRYWVRALMF